MKERFVFGSSKRTSGRRILLVTTLLAAIVLGFDLFSGGSVRAAVRGTVAHVWVTGGTGAQAVKNTGLFATHAMLAHEIASLKEQVIRYKSDAAANAALRDENEQLRTLVHLAAKESGVAAAIVSSFNTSPYGTFLISAHAPNVAVGDLVLSQGGYVIGRVIDAGGSTSLVGEMFASDNTLDGLVAGSAASIQGYGGGNARAALPRAVKIVAGDLVVAPTLGQRPVGVVERVESSASSADQKVFIRVPVNLSELRYVYVVSGR